MAIQAGETTFYQAKRGIVQDGLVLNMDAGVKQSYDGGTTWRDLTGGNNGTLQNGPIFNKDKGGNIVFDGSDDHMGTISIPNETGELTCEVAMNYDALNAYHNVFEAGFNVRPMLWIDSANKLECSYPTGNGGYTSPSSYASQDIIVTVIYNSNSSPGIKLNVNGAYVGQNSQTHPTWANLRDFYFFNRTASSEFSGTIYFFRFYNRALTATEVLQNYNATRHRFGV